ncbi:pseudouridine synthase [Mycoplasma sp. B6188]|uniref:pseudouridine synthase n=1 Tax=Mycoplasma sp. B6188 TaxID=3401673 RepID=UPI003AAACE4D
MQSKIRLDKFLAQCLGLSRSQAAKVLKSKLVTLNGEIVTHNLDINLSDIVSYQGQELSLGPKYHYYALNKPAGYICANYDNKNQTVFDLLDSNINQIKDIHTVGRLDKDTTGLLLITNDGELTHQLLAPKKHVNKTYYVTLKNPCPSELVQVFASGFELGQGEKVKPAKLEIISPTFVHLTISEGKYHQVKRMFAKFGNEVVTLHRQCFDTLSLDNLNLAPGEYKELKWEEIK